MNYQYGMSDKNKSYVDCGDLHLPKSQYQPLQNDNMDDKSLPKSVSIVHISDTHQKHNYMNNNIPYGDILIHTGDFLHKCSSLNDDGSLPDGIKDFNDWIGNLPHKIKIVICGNHEGILCNMKPSQISKILSNVTYYLQDSSINIYGINFYGVPWTINASRNKAFGVDKDNEETELNQKFDCIPTNCDIVLSHSPPYNINDLAWRRFYDFPDKCVDCGKIHRSYAHWGSKYLLKQIYNRIKPIACLYGHVHDSSGHSIKNGILFCNSAMTLNYNYCHKFNVVFDLEPIKIDPGNISDNVNSKPLKTDDNDQKDIDKHMDQDDDKSLPVDDFNDDIIRLKDTNKQQTSTINDMKEELKESLHKIDKQSKIINDKDAIINESQNKIKQQIAIINDRDRTILELEKRIKDLTIINAEKEENDENDKNDTKVIQIDDDDDIKHENEQLIVERNNNKINKVSKDMEDTACTDNCIIL